MFNIALNTFKEIVRNKFLYIILVFAFAFIIFSISLWALTLWNDNKIIVDFWLAMIEIFWIIGVLFVWSQLLFNEINGKTIFLILSKPIKRSDFILWKFIWFSYTIYLIVIFQAILFLWVLLFKDIAITKLILFSIFYTFLKLEILLAIVLFFSTFMSNMLTIVVSIMVYFASHSLNLVLDLIVKTKNIMAVYVYQGISLIFPPLEALNIKDVIGSFSNFSWSYLLLNSVYALFYIGVVMMFTIVIFNKKKFEW